jgi:hypothetical protein
MRAKGFGQIGPALLLFTVLSAGSASAYNPYDPHNCNGFDWDDKRALVVQKITAKPRVNFIKSPYDDDFKAEACPADTEGRKKSYLVTGDLVLTGKTLGAFTCISYHSPLAKKQIWVSGWLPSTALAPVAPMASPKISDWLGTWYQAGGGVEIKRGDGGKLHIEGEMVIPAGRDTHNGDFKADLAPQDDTIAFADEGGYGDGCQVRMQRIGPWLMVEDNGGCGGAGVTFGGLYRRKK